MRDRDDDSCCPEPRSGDTCRVTESDWDAESLREMKPGDRWPNEPPAAEGGPDGGVREPRRPRGPEDSGALELSADEDV